MTRCLGAEGGGEAGSREETNERGERSCGVWVMGQGLPYHTLFISVYLQQIGLKHPIRERKFLFLYDLKNRIIMLMLYS